MTAQTIFPHLCIQGAADAVEFYKKALGATEVMRVPHEDGKRLMHAAIDIGGAQVFIHDDFPEYKECHPDKVGAPANRQHLDHRAHQREGLRRCLSAREGCRRSYHRRAAQCLLGRSLRTGGRSVRP